MHRIERKVMSAFSLSLIQVADDVQCIYVGIIDVSQNRQ